MRGTIGTLGRLGLSAAVGYRGEGVSMSPRLVVGARRVVPWVVVAVLVASLAWGLTAAFAASGSPSPSGKVVLRIGWTSEPDNLNPFIGLSSYEIWALNYSYLFGCGDHNQPTLDLATEFPTRQNGGISADGRVWTIRIRSGVQWQDGEPLTAADVAFTYTYVIKNDMTNFTNYTLGIKTVSAIDPTTVRIVCSAPKADLERALVPILPEHIWAHVAPAAAQSSYAVQLPLVGSGPFETVVFKKGSYVEMVRNPYWYGRRPAIDQIYFELYQDADTMVSDLKTGALDAAWGIPEAQFAALRGSTDFKAVAYNYYDWDYLEFNCYDKASSLGNPVLRDWRFRTALNYAIDRQRLCAIAYSGLATPGTTIIPPHTFFDPDYHWQPPAGQLYTFDLTKASQLLTAAGYPLVNGRRLNKQGKPITLRLYSPTDSDANQVDARLIAGWLETLGIRIRLSVVDDGALTSDIYNAHGSVWKPDFDLVVWDWTGYYDPGQTLSCLTTSEIGSLDEPFWSDRAYDALNPVQASTIDPRARQAAIWQMQQIMYQQTPWIVLAYPDYLEAYDTSRWTGWQQMFGGSGPAFDAEGFIGSYLTLRPRSATSGGGSGNAVLIVVAVVGAVLVAALVVLLLRRRGPRPEEA
jgi:peptide/nickel transport system substrate-binding protein